MKVTHLQLKKTLFVPGLPQFNKTLTQEFYPGIEMKLHDLGVHCSWKGHDFIVNEFECAVVEAPSAKAPAKKS